MNTNDEYRQILKRLISEILPFWLEHGMDRDEGGVFACFDGITGERVADHKFMWVQGRMLWLFSRLHEFLATESPASPGMAGNPSLIGDVGEAAHSIYRFVSRVGVTEQNRVPFLVTPAGAITTLHALGIADNDDPLASTFSDCFVAMGLAAYGRVFDEASATARGRSILESTIAVLRDGGFRTHPYPEPEGLESLGSRMILAMAAGEFRPAPMAEQFILQTFRDLRERFLRPDGFFRELVPRGSYQGTTVLLEYTNPGHSLETYSLLQEHADLAAHAGWDTALLETGTLMTIQGGWDHKHGGMFAFVVPGISIDGENDGEIGMAERFRPDDTCAEETLYAIVKRDWSLKLWWPQVEGMLASLTVGTAAKNKELVGWYEKLREYAFRTFPDPAGKEWIHIRDRRGTPIRRVVALPVKDPYHIARCFLKILLVLRHEISW